MGKVRQSFKLGAPFIVFEVLEYISASHLGNGSPACCAAKKAIKEAVLRYTPA